MPLSLDEATYDAIQSVDHHSNCDDIHLIASDSFSLPSWLGSPPPSFDYLSKTFPSNESIMDIMSLEDLPCKYHHHQSSFLSRTIENNIKSIVLPKVVQMSQSTILTHDVLSEGNFGNITLTMFIDISEKLVSWNTFNSANLVALKRSKLIWPCLNNSVMFSLGAMKKCQGLIHP